VRRDRDADALRRDIDTRMDSDRYEIGQLRTSLEIAKSEIRQLRAERAILTGQLDVARSEQVGGASRAVGPDERDEARMPSASFSPMIDISEKSLRATGGAAFEAEPTHIAPAE